MPPRQKTLPTEATSPAEHGLGLPSPSARLLSLRRRKAEVLKRIRAKKKEVSRLERAVEQAETIFGERVVPLIERCRELNRQIREDFGALLAGSLTKREKRTVRSVLRALLREGILLDELDDDARGVARSTDEADVDDGAPFAEDRSGGGYSAAPKGAQPNQDSLKALFKRLALALHPDRVQDDTEKLQRTDAMKGVVSAYERGDLEGLLQIERGWALPDSSKEPKDAAQEERTLERELEELAAQLVDLRRTARELRASDALQFVPDEQPRRGKSSLDRLVVAVENDLDDLVKIRDLVVAFRKREITLAQFLEGPQFTFGGAEFDLDDLLHGVLDEAHETEGRRRKNSRRRRDRR